MLGFFLFDSPARGIKLDISSLMDNSVVLVEDQHIYCAGVWISFDQILTAGHCVVSKQFVTYLDYRDFTSGKFGMRVGQVVRVGYSDLALIKVVSEDRQHGIVSVYSGGIEAGMEGHIIGHPKGQVYTYMKGWVSSIRNRDGIWFLQVQAPVFLGNSGGGIFDDRGRLLGISSSMSLLAPSTGYFVSHREILEFLGEDS